MKNYLNFEKEIKELDEELEKLKDPYNQGGISEVDTKKISKTEEEINDRLQSVYSNLDPWQTTMVARHEDRPKSKFFIDNLFDDFITLSGDRYYGEDKSVIAGFAKFNNQSVLVIGQEKGEDLDSRIERNFGMMRPEGYRKTIRLMELADRFGIPIISFIDTPGAYPGVGAEERGQAEAIARSIECCMKLKVPTIAIIIGEGGSGGAIALASSNKVLMLENAIYSVISPEGCATILWRDPKKMLDAAKAMKLSAKDLLKLKVIDEVIEEPLGGAHRDRDIILNNVRQTLTKNLNYFDELSSEEIMNERKNKFLKIGRNDGFMTSTEDLSTLTIKRNNLELDAIRRSYGVADIQSYFRTYPFQSPDFSLISLSDEDFYHSTYIGWTAMMLCLWYFAHTSIWREYRMISVGVIFFSLSLGPVLVIDMQPLVIFEQYVIPLPYLLLEKIWGFSQLTLLYRFSLIPTLLIAYFASQIRFEKNQRMISLLLIGCILLEGNFLAPTKEIPKATDLPYIDVSSFTFQSKKKGNMILFPFGNIETSLCYYFPFL